MILFYGITFTFDFLSLGGAYSLFVRQGAPLVFPTFIRQGAPLRFRRFFVVFVVFLTLSPPKSPCFSPGPVTQTSVVSKLKLLHKYSMQCLLDWFQAVLYRLGVAELI